MGPSLATVHATASQEQPQTRRHKQLRLLDFNVHAAWCEFQRWWERDIAAPQIMSYRVQARLAQRKPSIEDRYVWAIDMSRSFEALAPGHRAILVFLVGGQSLQMHAHNMGVSMRTLIRRRDAALEQLAAIRSRYHEERHQ
jgi:hypothetical protein